MNFCLDRKCEECYKNEIPNQCIETENTELILLNVSKNKPLLKYVKWFRYYS